MNEKINKSAVVKMVAKKIKKKYNLKYSQESIKNVIDAFMEVITDVIENGDSVKLNSYMLIKPKYYSKKRARNIYEGKEIVIPAEYRVKIVVGSKLKKACKKLSERKLDINYLANRISK